ncbi:1-phosphatidylinositol 4,5-bisphosphate phosphodiesterase eta-2-like [Tachyglossus aculeatus]|uniref:1-phosphatidylinositol 4,5-bisphosphate phosphodiesterase eta-2-like n=1 Tax=Tachyglossus aculeatus TaxID=9261 RepID=UPI0018F68412|nr:1-phosphatidylinositol 4,5-bisphosphate phosphodiesterase eta-2-like [Tachyglossus aculeatus]
MDQEAADARRFSMHKSVTSLCSLETITEEPASSQDRPDPQEPAPLPPAGHRPEGCGPLPGPGMGRAGPGPEGWTGPPTAQREEKGPEAGLSSGPGRGWTGGRGGPGADPRPSEVIQARRPPAPQVRRAKSEGQVTCDPSLAAAIHYSDVTGCDRLWCKLDPASPRDSLSSSSSMSSNDTVIDLSLPNLTRRSLPCLGPGHEPPDGPPGRRAPPRPLSATAEGQQDPPPVTKSKSNPNLRSAEPPPAPAPPRRPSWGRLYLQGLHGAWSLSGPAVQPPKSKSLGDLTSDDFVPRPSGVGRGVLRSVGRGLGPRPARRQDRLTEQLRRLTAFQTAGDITSPTSLDPAGDVEEVMEEKEEEEEEGAAGPGVPFLRRSSSRSQSRVRSIAQRARQAQERQRRQRLNGGHGALLEERGNPEGACSVSRGVCADLGLTGHFASLPKSSLGLTRDSDDPFIWKL